MPNLALTERKRITVWNVLQTQLDRAACGTAASRVQYPQEKKQVFLPAILLKDSLLFSYSKAHSPRPPAVGQNACFISFLLFLYKQASCWFYAC